MSLPGEPARSRELVRLLQWLEGGHTHEADSAEGHMILRRAIDWAIRRVSEIEFYWTVKPYVDEIEKRLEEPLEVTPWRWIARRMRTSLRMALANGNSWLVLRLVLRSVLRHRKRMTDSSISETERRRELYLGVMESLKFISVLKRHRFNWSADELRRSMVIFAFDLAGVKLSFGPTGKPWAISAWEGNVPHIKVDPRRVFHAGWIMPGIMGPTLFHELFHLAAPAGRGLVRHGHVREELANRFAHNMSHPFPGIVHAAKTNADILMNGPVKLEEVMWATRRRMFTIRIPATRDYVKSHIVVQAPESFSPRALKIEGHPVEQDLRYLLLWATSSLIDFYPPHTSWSPPGTFQNALGRLSFQISDVMYYGVGNTALAMRGLAKCGVVDPRKWLPGRTSHYIRSVPEIDLGDCTIGGGRYLVAHREQGTIVFPKGHATSFHQLVAIEDGDGNLASAWAEAGKRGEAGPLLLPGDQRSVISSDWWSMSPDDWLDGPFDAWKDTIDKGFMGTPFSPSDLQHREWREELLILEIFQDHDSREPTRYWAEGETTHPAFRAHRITKLLLNHDKHRGSWKVAQEPIHSWAEELSDHPVLLRAVAYHRRDFRRMANPSESNPCRT